MAADTQEDDFPFTEEDALLFEADVEFLFDHLIGGFEEGHISAEQVERFFPQDVKDRVSQLQEQETAS